MNRSAKAVTYRASSAQERLWFLDRLFPGSGAYSISLAYDLQGPVDVDALRRAFEGVVRRHESLRTRFAIEGDVLTQRVDAHARADVEVVEARASTAATLAAWDAAPFDLSRGSLVRMRVLRSSDVSTVVCITAHHIVCDAHSLDVVFDELSSLYSACVEGRMPELPAAPQLGPQLESEADRLAESKVLDQLEFWGTTLAGAPELVRLPADRTRPARQSLSGATVARVLPADVTRQLDSAAKTLQATPFMITAAALVAELSRYSGETDVVVGFPIANRSPKTERVVGFLGNTLVLRIGLDDDPTFRALVERVRDASFDAFRNRDVPFDRVVDRLGLQPDLSRPPLFQVFFSYYLAQDPEFAGLSCTRLVVPRVTTPFDVSLVAERRTRTDELALLAEFNADLFDGWRVDQLLRHYERFLRTALAEPDTPSSRVAMLDDDDLDAAIARWNATARSWPPKTIVDLFREQMSARPEKTAVRSGSTALSYEELARRVDALATSAGQVVDRGDRVGIFLEPSVDLAVALLATASSGAAYVPLDPDYPDARIASMLEDADARAVVTTSALAPRLPPCGAALLTVDRLETHGARPEREPPRPGDVAYVIYTSGSTGRPKGVAITHGSLTNLLHSMAELIEFRDEDTILSVTSISFDIAALELFLPLTRGGTIVLADQKTRKDPDLLSRLLAASGATVMQATPTLWRMLLEAGDPALERVRVLCGGEPLPPRLAVELAHRGQKAWNVYGPTETTIWSSADELAGAGVTIGYPLANTRLYVLDAHRSAVPLGVQGEVYIAGAGLARGYFRDERLTAERFVPDPYGAAGALMYRTGDLGARRRDGRIELHGRNDRQVKLRGFRFELGEIEAAMQAVAGVAQAAAVVRDVGPDPQVVGYVVRSTAQRFDPASVRPALRERLPAHMVPSRVVEVPALPLTANGKIDVNALPAASPAATPRAPETPAEATLCSLWAEFLGVAVGPDDSFFDLGGDSLSSIRLIRHCAQAGVEIDLVVLYERQSVREILAAQASAPEREVVEA